MISKKNSLPEKKKFNYQKKSQFVVCNFLCFKLEIFQSTDSIKNLSDQEKFLLEKKTLRSQSSGTGTHIRSTLDCDITCKLFPFPPPLMKYLFHISSL